MPIYEDEEEENKKKRRSGSGGAGGGGAGASAGFLAGALANGSPSAVLSRAVGMMAAGRGNRVGGAALTRLANALGDKAPGTVYSYPDMNHTFNYGDILAVLPEGSTATGWHNHTFKDAFTDALEYQDIEDHNAALNKYIKPGQTPAERRAAIIRGEKEEQRLMGFWKDDRRPRRNTGAKSTAVSGVKLRNNMVWVQFGGRGKWYAYRGGNTTRQAAHEAAKLLRSRSIGQAINGQWGRTHKLW